MNAQATVQTSFSAETDGGKVFVTKGEVYDGTLTDNGVFVFHVTNGSGKICEVRVWSDSTLLKIKRFALEKYV